MDIIGPMKVVSRGGNRYARGLIDDFTGKTDILFLPERSGAASAVKQYVARSEGVTERNIQNLRLENAGKHQILKEIMSTKGITLELSPPRASQRNGVGERPMQEMDLRARVHLFCCQLDNYFWAEAMSHGNCLRNFLPSERIGEPIPITLWKPYISLKISNIPPFGTAGYAFIYAKP